MFECNTIQVLPGAYRLHALNAIAAMVAPGAAALVSWLTMTIKTRRCHTSLPGTADQWLTEPKPDGIRAKIHKASCRMLSKPVHGQAKTSILWGAHNVTVTRYWL